MLQVNSPTGSLSAWGPPSGIRREGGLLPVSGNLLFHSVTAYWFGDFGESPPFPALPEKIMTSPQWRVGSHALSKSQEMLGSVLK